MADALSDERTGLSFARVIALYVYRLRQTGTENSVLLVERVYRIIA
jgi:hypothetical protein